MADVREVVEFASDAAFAVGEDLRVLAWNKAAQNLLGYSPREAVGLRCYEVLKAVLPHGEPLCTPSCHGGKCFARQEPFSIPCCLALHRDGYRVPMGLLSNMVVPTMARGTGASASLVFLQPDQDTQSCCPRERPLRIYTLGHFCLVNNDSQISADKWPRKQSLTLLKYMVTHRGVAIHKERLLDYLWPGVSPTKARQRLKVTVYFLRQKMREAGIDNGLIETSGDGLILSEELVWVDADTFERLVTVGIELERGQKWDEALRCYQDALITYRGDYLEEETYADWCAEERERLREIYFAMMERMVHICFQHERYAEAAQICRTALVREPCREGFHRALMKCLHAAGRTDQALAQFYRCQSILKSELSVAPLPETIDLYRQIRAHNPRPLPLERKHG